MSAFLIILNIASVLLLLRALSQLKKVIKAMEELRAQVESTKGVAESARTLIQGLHDRLVAAGTDPAQLAAIASDLKASTDKLAEAVAANG